MTEPTIPATAPVDAPTPVEISAPALAEAGAAPVTVDVNALMEQIQKLQNRVDSMSAAAGIPSDPIEAAMKDLRDHINARKVANPGKDFSEILDALTGLSEPATADQVALLRTVLDDYTDGYVEGLDYIKALARKLHKLVLKG